MATETIEKPIDEQSADELVKTIAESQKAEATPPAEPAPAAKPDEPQEFIHTAGDGTVYKASSPEELFKKVTGALDTTKTALKDREYQIHDLKKPPKQEAPVTKQFEQQKYLDLLATDAQKAFEYQKEFDPDIQAIRQSREEKTAEERIKDEVVKFYRDVPDYAKIETKELNELMKERMAEKGRSHTAEALGLTYYELKHEGKITEPGKKVEQRKPMPTSAAGSGTTVESEPDLDNMTSKELIAYMKKNGVPGAEYIR